MGGLELARVAVGDLDRAARQVMRVALGVRPGERVAVIADEASVRIGDALVRAAEERESTVEACWLETEGARPLAGVPPRILDALAGAD
ncbi:MAG TPA: hypothetical protein RMH99_00605, partial [Sandaracinaceae bacterium LLY-WYZ-13_1]|nr:hypothetical protein [Sandaracinaceae bacterium LLY-WYZ-13_1]